MKLSFVQFPLIQSDSSLPVLLDETQLPAMLGFLTKSTSTYFNEYSPNTKAILLEALSITPPQQPPRIGPLQRVEGVHP